VISFFPAGQGELKSGASRLIGFGRLLRVKSGKARTEHFMSALHPTAAEEWTSEIVSLVPEAAVRLFNDRIDAYSDRSSHEFFAIRLPGAMYPEQKS
jgi:hypothetical protein